MQLLSSSSDLCFIFTFLYRVRVKILNLKEPLTLCLLIAVLMLKFLTKSFFKILNSKEKYFIDGKNLKLLSLTPFFLILFFLPFPHLLVLIERSVLFLLY